MKVITGVSKKGYFNWPCPRNLREVVKLSAIERETPETIKQIWEDFHATKINTIGKVVSSSTMQTMMKK